MLSKNKELYQFDVVQKVHLEEITELHQLSFSPPWSLNSFKTLLATPYVQGWIGRELSSSKLIGVVLGQILAQEAEIYTLAVHPAHRRRKIASSLLNFFILNCYESQVEKIYLEVSFVNTEALKLYIQAGFKIFGSRKNYYCDEKGVYTDAYLLEMKLKDENTF